MQRKQILANNLVALAAFLFLTMAAFLAHAGNYERFLERDLERFQLAKTPTSLSHLAFFDKNQKPVTLADFRGKNVLIALWATWCGYCRVDMPKIEELQARYGGADFTVLPISIDSDGYETVPLYYSENNFSHLPLYLDPQSSMSTGLEISGVPYFILVDRNGNEIGRKAGQVNWMSDDGQAFIKAVIAN